MLQPKPGSVESCRGSSVTLREVSQAMPFPTKYASAKLRRHQPNLDDDVTMVLEGDSEPPRP